jgi:hypothetical protein
MAKIRLEDGTEAEYLTPEEAKAQAEAAAAKALEDYKKANPEKTPEQIEAERKAAEEKAKSDAEPLNQLKAQLESVQKELRDSKIESFAKSFAGSDKAKQDAYKVAFGRLTGFEETTEGMAERAEAAARMIGVDPKTVNVGDVAGTGGNKNVDDAGKPVMTEADKPIQKALGITEEDVKKYGGEASKEGEQK